MARYVVAISGASGMMLGFRTLSELTARGYDIDFVMTSSALYTTNLEMPKELSTPQKWLQNLPKTVKLHSNQDIGASICSGSYPTEGMIIIPCSMSTVAALSIGLADNCLLRAADVTLKEKRPLIIVPRETPFSEIHLENMLRLAKRAVTILPPIPAWYTSPQTIEDVENFVMGKVFDHLKIEHNLYKKWGC